MQEEQERELEPEAEQEQQVERPPQAEALPHSLHPHISSFIMSGTVPPRSKAFSFAFQSLNQTTAGKRLKVDEFPRRLRVTLDFAKTVKEGKADEVLDAFQRDVRWILTASENGMVTEMVVISPFEADALMPEISKSSRVKLHIYSPRQSQGLQPIDDLQLHIWPPQRPTASWIEIPRHFITELNIFAGQLYFASFDDYVETCNYLQLSWKATDESAIVYPDGFIEPKTGMTGFKKSPVPFLQILMSKIRKNCGEIKKTHMGKILEGALLTEEDFEGLESEQGDVSDEDVVMGNGIET